MVDHAHEPIQLLVSRNREPAFIVLSGQPASERSLLISGSCRRRRIILAAMVALSLNVVARLAHLLEVAIYYD